MIFLTVGHQMPFDRLVQAVDEWAGGHPDIEIFGQIGEGQYQPRKFPFKRWLTSAQYEETLSTSCSVVSHAGTGTILQVLMKNKPLLVLPRRAIHNETRNDHQVGTARYFSDKEQVIAISDETELPPAIDQLQRWQPAEPITDSASSTLIARLAGFINDI